ncbi:MAG: HPr family phosphocarrier protein [Pseudomonadota bacterium]
MQSAQRVTIVNRKGLHARASNKLATLAKAYESDITIRHEEFEAKATEIMDLLMLVAHKGAEIEIEATGDDACEAVTALASLVADGFGERDMPGEPQTC